MKFLFPLVALAALGFSACDSRVEEAREERQEAVEEAREERREELD